MKPERINRLKKSVISASFAVLSVFAASSYAVPIGYSDYASWAGAAGTTTLIDFEAFAPGTLISDLLPGVSSVTGSSSNGVAQPTIDSSSDLAFPMFNPPLPSGTNFLSNGMSLAQGYSTGEMRFVFSGLTSAVGAFIADSDPLGGFSLEIFSGAASLGIIGVGDRTLPDSFVGITSDVAFDSVVFRAENPNDSWGLDNLEFGSPVSVPEPTTLTLMMLSIVGIGYSKKRRVA